MDYKVEDDFLPIDFFNQIRNEIYSGRMPFLFINCVADSNDTGLQHWYFIHDFYDNKRVLSSYYESILIPILDILDAKSIINAKVNIYPNTPQIIKHGLHRDHDFDVKSALINFSTCDGYTYLKEHDTKIESVMNRCLHFNSYNLHHSTTTTNAPIRVSMNINYF